MKSRIKVWAIVMVISLIFVMFDKWRIAENQEPTQITVNAPQAMHKAFINTFEDLELNKEYSLKFTNKEANFTITTQKNENAEEIAYSPIIAVFNEDEHLFEENISKEIFVPSDTEPEEYDFDFQKIMNEIIENPDSNYKVYYPDASIGNWSVFYNFLLYTANGGYYPKDETNMTETKELVEKFLKSKNTEKITSETIDTISGFSKNSIYLMTLADLGYIYESRDITCKVMYPKNVVFEKYYANFDENGKILYDSLEKDTKGIITGRDDVGYYNLRYYGNYCTREHDNVSLYDMELRENFNAVEIPETNYNEEEAEYGNTY